MEDTAPDYRRTTQHLLPLRHAPLPVGSYDIYPSHQVPRGSLHAGVESLARRIAAARSVVIDGMGGVLWERFREQLDGALRALGVVPRWRPVEAALLPPEQIERLVAPWLGGSDPLWGTRWTGSPVDFFDRHELRALAEPDPQADLDIVYGVGAALVGCEGLLVYCDVPKNEIQFRARAGLPVNVGLTDPLPPKPSYKRSYFVDWPALNRHRHALLSRIDVVVDVQRAEIPVWTDGDVLRSALDRMAHSVVRARPWFEPGPWGGQWMKERITGLPESAQNLAWSFELIAPENGLLLSDDGLLLEVAFDTLMHACAAEVLGEHVERFGLEFPIRFDYLDTFEGGNLSVQCHPQLEYIQQEFGESITQDETYYILDCAPGARVYLGFTAECDADAFRSALERSEREGTPVEIDRYVHSLPAHRGDLFLIPNGTVHCSGRDNLVLEISATPYIFTFKMYDWLRLDLDGRPRPLNVARAWQNLRFERRGERVQEELVSVPRVLEEREGWRLVHLPTHPDHFYDVHRAELSGEGVIHTEGGPLVMNVVQGEGVEIETADGTQRRFSFAETFIIPAAARWCRLRSPDGVEAKVVIASIKRG